MPMRKRVFAIAFLSGLTLISASRIAAQGQAPPTPVQAPVQTTPGAQGGPDGRRGGGFVPGQQRPPGDPVEIARGKTLYGISCTGCHGADLRGGDLGGPSLLRSQVVASDNDGELILPIIQGSRQNTGMPAIKMSPDDAKTIATFIHSVASAVG